MHVLGSTGRLARRGRHIAILGALAALASLAASSASSAGTAASTSMTYVDPTALTDLAPDGPHLLQAIYNIYVNVNTGEGLLRLGTHTAPNRPVKMTDLAPALAQSYKVSKDGKTLTFKLRSGVKSSFGHPLTAADVKYTFDRLTADGGLYHYLRVQGSIAATNPVTIVNKSTVQLHLDSPNTVLPAILTIPTFTILDSTEAKAHATGDDPWSNTWLSTNSDSYGPYVVSSFVPSQQIVLTANPRYWRLKPKMKKITISFVADASARAQLALSGQADFVNQISASDLPQFKSSNAAATAHVTYLAGGIDLNFNLKDQRWQNPNLRKAINAAIDRSGIATGVFFKASTPITGCMPSNIALPPAAKKMGFSPNANVSLAKSLLAKANVNPANVPITIGYGPTPQFPEVARVVQSNLQALGFPVKLQAYASSTDYFAAIVAGKLDAFIQSASAIVATPGYYLGNNLKTGASGNNLNFSDPQLDAVIDQVVQSSGKKYNAAVTKACQMILDDSPQALIVNSTQNMAVSKKLYGWKAYPDYYPRFYELNWKK